MSACRRQRGFSMMELLMVIALMGMLVGVTVPIFRGTVEGQRLPMVAGTLAETIRYARSTCVTRAARGRLVIAAEARTMHLEVEENPLDAPGSYTTLQLPYRMRDVLGKGILNIQIKQRTPKGLETAEQIDFMPDGRCTDTFVYLYGANDRIYTVSVVGISGQVMVFDHQTESYYESKDLGA